jgi:hypothetical protein
MVAPTIGLRDVGWDDNILHTGNGVPSTADFRATLSPDLDATLRLPFLRLSGRSDLDLVYFKQHADLRSIDANETGRIEVPLGRLTPFAGGGWAYTRYQRNFEIDLPVRRVQTSWDVGVDVKFSGKTSMAVQTRGSRVGYKGDAVFLDTELARYLDATTRAEGATIRYALTPLTTIGADVEQYRSRFPAEPSRDSDGVRTSALIEFKPLAHIRGSARFGAIRRTFLDGSFPQFRGSVASVDLGYTLFGQTRFDVRFQRDLSFSFREDQRDYLQTGAEISVTHRLGNAWDVRGSLGRYRLAFHGAGTALPLLASDRRERTRNYGIDVGRFLGRTRVGVQVARQTRSSDFGNPRGYERTLIASSVAYGF